MHLPPLLTTILLSRLCTALAPFQNPADLLPPSNKTSPADSGLPAYPDPLPPSNQTTSVNDTVAAPEASSSSLPPEVPQSSVPYFFFPDPALAPNQTDKNCKGSAICSSTGDACMYAAGRYVDDLVYKNYTSYVRDKGKLEKCTAIFTCDDDKYGDGMTGRQIKAAFARLWTPAGGYGKVCKHCGSAYLANGCHVTANYCKSCADVNIDLPQRTDPQPVSPWDPPASATTDSAAAAVSSGGATAPPETSDSAVGGKSGAFP